MTDFLHLIAHRVQLRALNLEVPERIDRDQPVTAPGVPPDYPDPDGLVTDDCIR